MLAVINDGRGGFLCVHRDCARRGNGSFSPLNRCLPGMAGSYSPFFIARESGLYRNHGLDMERSLVGSTPDIQGLIADWLAEKFA